MLKKSSRISSVTAGLKELVFQRSQRADPPAKLQSCRPKCGRKMNPEDPAPPNRENSTEQYKDNEGEVDQKDKVSKDLPKHEDDPDVRWFQANPRSKMDRGVIPKTSTLFLTGGCHPGFLQAEWFSHPAKSKYVMVPHALWSDRNAYSDHAGVKYKLEAGLSFQEDIIEGGEGSESL